MWRLRRSAADGPKIICRLHAHVEPISNTYSDRINVVNTRWEKSASNGRLIMMMRPAWAAAATLMLRDGRLSRRKLWEIRYSPSLSQAMRRRTPVRFTSSIDTLSRSAAAG